jgi:anti-sigma regulatory factor (Ser/Thr protein kinase)
VPSTSADEPGGTPGTTAGTPPEGTAFPAAEQLAAGPGPAPRRTTAKLPAAPVSSRLARELVRTVTGRPEDVRVALIVTELVANAITHAGAAPTLTVIWDGTVVRLEVFDDGPGWPALRRVEATDTSGRGVALVASVADRWGVVPVDGGKVVWAEVALRDPAG